MARRSSVELASVSAVAPTNHTSDAENEKCLVEEHESTAAAVHKQTQAAGVVDEMLFVDDERANEIRAELAANRQGGWAPINSEEKRMDRRLNMKFDLFIIPLVSLGYMFNQLDRSNLGNAQTAGFSDDLHMNPNDVNNAASLFFATYIPFIPFAAAIGRKLGGPRFMAITQILWGVLTISHAFVKNRSQLLAVRLLMGFAECGFYPIVLSYISDFYPRYHCAFRYALFYGFFSIAGAFGGLIAYGILGTKGRLYSWQYLFIIEGSVPILLGLICPFWLAKGPRSAWYLTPEERLFAEKRMAIDSADSVEKEPTVTKRDLKEAFTDWKVWMILVSNTMASISSQGFTTFFPVVVKGLGYSGVKANLMTVPPYIGGAVGVWLFAWSSDRFKERTYHQLAGGLIVILGLILTIVIPLGNIGGRYAGLFILLFGGFIHSPLAISWLAGNIPVPGKRAVAIGITGWANVAGIIGTQLYRAKYGPGYLYPLRVTVGLIAVGWVGFAATSIMMRLVNRSRAKRVANMTAEEIEVEQRSDERRGDAKYTFVYGL